MEDPRLELYNSLKRDCSMKLINTGVNNIFKRGSDEDIMDMMLLVFQTRDVRGGKGEYELFYKLIHTIYTIQPQLVESVLELIPEYGSWNDIFVLADLIPQLKYTLLRIAAKQLVEDETNLLLGKPVLFLGKWAPRENKRLNHIAKDFAYLLAGPQHPSVKHSQIMATFRRRFSRLNAKLGTVETYECSNRWELIDPAKVPLGAQRVKINAYLNDKNISNYGRNKCRERFLEYEPLARSYIPFNKKKMLASMEELRTVLDSTRYDLVREKVSFWIQGGWRGI
jgi:hypothetical protein